MNSDTFRIDLLNIFLIALSLVLAIKVPFELFLVSYAVLGPLHYLTEINWLKEKSFFLKSNGRWVLILTIIVSLMSLSYIIVHLPYDFNDLILKVIRYIAYLNPIFFISLFLFSISLVFFRKTIDLIIFLLLSFSISLILSEYIPSYIFALGIFIPTLIHVYLFTILFIIYGSINSKSKLAMLNALLLLIVPILIFNLSLDSDFYAISAKTSENISNSGVSRINLIVSKIFDPSVVFEDLYTTGIGIKIQIFIAFAYTYHYLNWFSKTSVIGWRKNLNKKKLSLIVIIWLISIIIYSYDYRTGFIVLFFLSSLHVIMEFPLNIITIKALFSFLRNRIKKAPWLN